MPHSSIRGGLAVALLLFPIGLVGCNGENEPSGPMAEAAGSYEATTLIEKEGGVDHLAEGASLIIRLTAGGETTGTFFVPGGDEDGSDYTADLTGTWTRNGNAIEFHHAADTFIRDAVWTWHEDGTITMDNSELTVVLMPRLES